jgi:anti-anti-sigma factor
MFESLPSDEKTHTLVRLRGELTSATAPQLDATLAALLTSGQSRWLLDLSELTFSASAGLRVFLSYAKKNKNAGGRLVFCSVQPAVLDVLTTSGFTQILTLVPTAAEGRQLLATP